ncbi:sigma-54-dependent transcriptional regulator [Azospira restricta]|uniref:Sigma-54-dependent Fis family transcriptional regulator n=1 Tax=Azospira restricta TaxID=404405 RepID=A0A974PY00_9RHOO|nr:sigma-54 dependent transcriptional regulator [Azospira restricta]QRJ63542.1 sigma-54-dependent Fis family transcriptional regulator [Azospira restricta]
MAAESAGYGRLPVFLVEDDPDVRRGCEQTLAIAGLPVRAFADAEGALAAFARELPGVVVSDVRLPGRDGLALLRELRQRDRELPVVLVTGHGDVAMAVQAMREGAHDFIEKPFAAERLTKVVQQALEKRALLLENRRLRERLDEHGEVPVIGQSPGMVAVRRLIAALAATDVDILINGETGCGKEVVARAIHAASGRRGPFVAINCAALPESVFESEMFGHEAGAFTGAGKRRIGKVEYASGGTLFLDEIESMPLALQAKLLRVLQERVVERLGGNAAVPVDCRVLAATKENLAELSAAGRFRADLYYRLNVASLDLPPLRERKEDLPLLMGYFLHQAAQRYGRPAPEWGAADLLRWQAHDWPGNVRELKNVADRLCLGLPDGFAQAAGEASPALAAQVERAERSIIENALQQCAGNVARAADLLQLPKKTLYDKLARHGIAADAFRR